MDFQMFKLVLEKAEEPEIKLPTSPGSSKAREFHKIYLFLVPKKKKSSSALWTKPKPLTLWITINVENSQRDGNTRLPDLPLEKPVCRSGSNS